MSRRSPAVAQAKADEGGCGRGSYLCFLLLTFCFALSGSGCGFSPVYGERGHRAPQEDGKLRESFAAVRVDPITFGRAGQRLQGQLEDLLHPAQEKVQDRYVLHVDLKKNIEGLGIQRNREITRYDLEVTATYRLTEIATGRELTKGTSRMVEGYDAALSDFATFSAEEDTLQRIMGELARDIHTRLSSYFLSDAGLHASAKE